MGPPTALGGWEVHVRPGLLTGESISRRSGVPALRVCGFREDLLGAGRVGAVDCEGRAGMGCGGEKYMLLFISAPMGWKR